MAKHLCALAIASTIAVIVVSPSALAAPVAARALVSPALLDEAATTTGDIEALAVLREPADDQARVPGNPARERYIRAVTDALSADLGPAGVQVIARFQELPIVALRLPARALGTVAADPRVASVSPNLRVHATRTEGKALMHVPDVHAEGYKGAGIGIAILDSGVNYDHDELTATVKLWDAIDNDADPKDEYGHGSSVAGIAAGSGNGVAPEATPVAVRVLDKDGNGTGTQIMTGVDKILSSVASGNPYHIRVANMSFGGYFPSGPTPGNCDSLDPAFAKAFSDLSDAGVLVVASAGNGGCTTGVAWPACISSAIAVGAVYDDYVGTWSYGADQCTSGCTSTGAPDAIACYSDSGDQLSVWAPADCATTTSRFGATGMVGCFNGTSAAAPYVSGVAALLFQATGATVAQVRNAIVSSGRLIADTRNDVVRRRVDAVQALTVLRGTCTAPAAPTGLALAGAEPCGGTTAFTASWNAVPGATGYLVQTSTDAAFTAPEESLVTGTSFTGTFPGSADASEWVRVRANTSCADSDWSPPITVDYAASCAPAYTSVVSGIAHTPGFGSAFWYSDLAILNPTDTAVDVDLTFHGKTGMLTGSAHLEALHQVVWTDVLDQLFGAGGNDVGVVVLASTGPVAAVARTYSRTSSTAPSFGQAYPAVDVANALTSGELGVLPNLRSGNGYYTNLELVNPGSTAVTATVTYRDDSGAQLASDSIAVGPLERVTRLRENSFTGAPTGFAEVRVDTDGGRLIAFASVIDDTSKDPTTIPLTVVARQASTYEIVTGIARTPGYAPAFWYSDLAVLNTAGTSGSATLTFEGAKGTLAQTVTLPPSSQMVWQDVLQGLFGLAGTDVGYVSVEASQPVAVLARTYSQTSTSAPTFGQAYSGVSAAGILTAGGVGYLPGLRAASGYYSNIELVNAGSEAALVEVTPLSNAGLALAAATTVTVEAHQRLALNRDYAIPPGTTFASARVRVVSGAVTASASVIDEASKDPTTIPMTVAP